MLFFPNMTERGFCRFRVVVEADLCLPKTSSGRERVTESTRLAGHVESGFPRQMASHVGGRPLVCMPDACAGGESSKQRGEWLATWIAASH